MPEEVFELNHLPHHGDIKIPPALPVLPLRGLVAFPDSLLPLTVARPRSVRAVNDALGAGKLICLITQRDPAVSEPVEKDLYRFGVAASILRVLRMPDDQVQILAHGVERVELVRIVRADPVMVGEIAPRPDAAEESTEVRALASNVANQFARLVDLNASLPDELKIAAVNIISPGRLADFVAAHIIMTLEEREELLETLSVRERLEKLSARLGRDVEVAQLGEQIQASVQERLTKGQREFFLREQLQAIRKELGEGEDEAREAASFREKIAAAGMPEEARKEADKEVERLERMSPQSPEYSMLATYLDWMAALPWSKETEDNLDLAAVRAVLDADHWDLEKIKDRIIEYVAVLKLRPDGRGPILCFVGPPGVGKTSLGQSIAHALGRKFARMSLGGVHDEAEIRGHRRTYIGALPGKIIQAIRRAESHNPLIMLDEVDKVGADFRGDPSSALLEVLDPEQNHTFMDHYLGVAFDLSRVMFIVTANILDTIPPALRDRLEVLRLPGYSEEEKIQIARRHLIPRQREAHGIGAEDLAIDDGALIGIIRNYTSEPGVRNLEREIARICRKAAVAKAAGELRGTRRLTGADLHEYLGPPHRHVDAAERTSVPGVSVGLAWTPAGGEILFIESARMPGRGRITLTGHLGEVMRESARTALTLVRSRSERLGIDPGVFAREDLHIHVPQGATAKDGPSAGVAMVVSLVSAYTDRPARPDTAMTGEITLRGKVLPVGGIKEKVLAARRSGIVRVILPDWNRNDLEDIPSAHLEGLEILFVQTIDEVLARVFEPAAVAG